MKLSPIDYAARIERACKEISEGAMLIMSQPEAIRNSDVHHHYRQESFLQYLTGFEEPGSALLLLGGKPKGQRAILFLREKDPLMELWTGFRLGIQDALKKLAIDQAFPIEELWRKAPEFMKNSERLYYRFGLSPEEDQKLIESLTAEKRLRGRHSRNSFIPVFDHYEISGRIRLRKGPEEIERMRGAAAISKKAYDKVFATVRPGMNERQVAGMLIGEFMAGGAEMEAYGSIVAGGVNACCLHYHENNCELKDGDMLLIDAGSQFQYYASDVTRTFPVGKSYTPVQKAMYEIVLDSQLKAIDAVKPGVTILDIHNVALRRLSEGMVELGLLKGSVDEIVAKKTYMDFYPHNTSHWIGMDVHDVGDYSEDGKPMALREGMVFTIEPGLYVQADNLKVPKEFRGLGIRIEDDILVTRKGADNLTKEIPKSVKEMENRH